MTFEKKTFQTLTFNLDVTRAAWNSIVGIVKNANRDFTIINKNWYWTKLIFYNKQLLPRLEVSAKCKFVKSWYDNII